MHNVIYAKCHYGKCHYGKCHYGKCHYGKCHYGKCHYGKCHYGKCHGVGATMHKFVAFQVIFTTFYGFTAVESRKFL